jgi:hypothetical protein
MNLNPLILPLRVTAGAARLTLAVTIRTASLLGRAVEIVRPASGAPAPAPDNAGAARPARPAPAPDTAGAAPARPATAPDTAGAARPVSPSPPPASPRAARPERPPTNGALRSDPRPPTPVSPTEASVKTIDDTPQLVRESADPGAANGAGAQIEVDPPWTGYDAMAADDVIERLAVSTPAELAVVQLYERSAKQRRKVLAAVQQRLQDIS